MKHQTSVAPFGWLKRIVGWRRCRKMPARKVVLIDFDNEMKIVTAHHCECGWLARWHDIDSGWLLLLPDGKIQGRRVVGWKPYEGWNWPDSAPS